MVGDDVRDAADGAARQMLEASFFRSSQYIALARGAMAMMNIPNHGQIDSLVLGLPLTVYGDKALVAHVYDNLLTEHQIPDRRALQAKDRVVTIKKLRIIPQVVGSLIAMSKESGLNKKVRETYSLTIDAGYGTLLWLVTRGLTPLPARSNGNMGGVSSLLQKVVRSMDPDSVTNINILDRLDNALRNSEESIEIDGIELPLAKYSGLLASSTSENLTELIKSIGNTKDINNIFLTGGGAHLYHDAVQRAFSNRKIVTAGSGARFTNVRGFQTIAETEA
jgi:plasmid segregation protein ParM